MDRYKPHAFIEQTSCQFSRRVWLQQKLRRVFISLSFSMCWTRLNLPISIGKILKFKHVFFQRKNIS